MGVFIAHNPKTMGNLFDKPEPKCPPCPVCPASSSSSPSTTTTSSSSFPTSDLCPVPPGPLGTFQIRNNNSNLCAVVLTDAARPPRGTPVNLDVCSGERNALWQQVPTGNGKETMIMNPASGICLNLNNGHDGHAQLYDCAVNTSQWEIQPASGNSVYLQNKDGNSFLNVKDNQKRNGATIHGFDQSTGNPGSKWQLVTCAK